MNTIKFTKMWLFVAVFSMCSFLAMSVQAASSFFVNVTNIEELYAAVNNPANAGKQIVLAQQVYTLSATAPNGTPRPNGGRLELQENMSLRGVTGNRGAVVIDASNLPASSYAAPNSLLPNTGAIRAGRGFNAVEWLTIRNVVTGGAGVIVHLNTPGSAFARIAHIASTGNQRGIDVRNVVTETPGNYFIWTEIYDNDLYANRRSTGQGLRIINVGGTSGSKIFAVLNGNRSYNNNFGLLAANIGSTNAGFISITSTNDRFYDNGGGALLSGALGLVGNGNTINFTAVGTNFENNTTASNFDKGGLIALGGENTTNPNGMTNNTVNISLVNCRLTNNQEADLKVFGARSMPETVGLPGTNNRVTVNLFASTAPNIFKINSLPESSGAMNSAIVNRIF